MSNSLLRIAQAKMISRECTQTVWFTQHNIPVKNIVENHRVPTPCIHEFENIVDQKPALAEAKKWDGVKDKLQYLEKTVVC